MRAGTRCLDYGSGNGRTSGPALRALEAVYVGVDISESAVRAARELGLDASVITDSDELPFASGSFDFVTCIEVLEHLFRPDLAAAEIRRVMASRGVLVVTVPNVTYWRRRVDLVVGRWHPCGDDRSVAKPWRDPHIRFFTPSTLRRMLLQAGFDRVEVGAYGGALLRDIPGVRRLTRDRLTASGVYRRVEARIPSLCGARVIAVAHA